MRVAAFSTKKYERELLNAAKLAYGHDLVYFDSLLKPETASLAAGFAAVCAFVNDRADAPTIDVLARGGTRLIATRSTGFNHVDLKAAAKHGIAVVRVVDYSPYSVAEFAVGLLLALNRKIHRAYNRTRDGSLELDGPQATVERPVPLVRACPGRFARQPRRASVSYLARCMIVVEHYDSGRSRNFLE